MENVTSSDLFNNAFTMVVYKSTGHYQVMLGRMVPGSTQFRNPPLPLLPASSTPLEARLLKVEQNWVWVAVLNAAEKKITIVKHFMPDSNFLVIGEPDPIQTVALEALMVGTVPPTVTRPHLFNVNRSTNEMVFVDISETSSRFVTLPFAWAGDNLTPPTLAAVTDLQGASPASLNYDSTPGQAGWAFHDAAMELRRVRTQRELTILQIPTSLLTNEATVQFYLSPTNTNSSTEEEGE